MQLEALGGYNARMTFLRQMLRCFQTIIICSLFLSAQQPSQADDCSIGVFGDHEREGDIDIIDFGAFADSFDSASTDFIYDECFDSEPDGDIDIIDFGLFADNFGFGSVAKVSIGTVPEPTTLMQTSLGLVFLCGFRRR